MFKRRKPLAFWNRLREYFWPKSGWMRIAQYAFYRLMRLDDAPRAIAIGMACGAFVSASPVLGTHFITAVILALILRGNVVASLIGTWVGNPISFPFIWWATYRLGQFLLARQVDINVPALNFSAIWDRPVDILLPMLVGAVPVGLVLGVVTYFFSFWLIRGYTLAYKRVKRGKDARKFSAKKAMGKVKISE